MDLFIINNLEINEIEKISENSFIYSISEDISNDYSANQKLKRSKISIQKELNIIINESKDIILEDLVVYDTS